jgi:hypothetical protein
LLREDVSRFTTGISIVVYTVCNQKYVSRMGSVIPMTTSFGNDILPMFRPGDIACMTPKGVRLGDASWVCDPAGNDDFPDHANARRVFAALSSGFMPPGHRWSQDSLDLYASWMGDGFQP